MFWNVAISNTRMHLFFRLYSLAETRSGLSLRMAWASGGTRGLMEVMILRYCPLLRPRPHSTSSQQHFPRQAMERDGYSACHNGHFTAERERLCQGTMGLFREVVLLLPGPSLGLCSQRTFIRLLLSPIWWRSVCRQPQGRVWEWPPFIPQNSHVERSQQPRT